MAKVSNVASKPQAKKTVEKFYCRKCMKNKVASGFYEATNPMLDSNGLMSICRDCCQKIYDKYFAIYGNIPDALDYTCRDLDVLFSESVLEQTQSHIETLISKGRVAEAVFGYYKSKLGTLGKANESLEIFRYNNSDFLKRELLRLRVENSQDDKGNEEIEQSDEVFWGGGFTPDDLHFLNIELSNWRKTHKCDNQAEITLLKEICIKVLTIRNKRASGDSTTSDLKELQELMKTASVDPAKANAASSGKSSDCFGVWVKDIEQLRPAEWYDQQEKYKDIDGFIPYIKNYIFRPIKNFFTGDKDFIVDDGLDGNLDNISVTTGDMPDDVEDDSVDVAGDV